MPNYEVFAGNVGCVYRGPSEQDARAAFAHYAKASRERTGRVWCESVYLFRDGEPIASHEPMDHA